MIRTFCYMIRNNSAIIRWLCLLICKITTTEATFEPHCNYLVPLSMVSWLSKWNVVHPLMHGHMLIKQKPQLAAFFLVGFTGDFLKNGRDCSGNHTLFVGTSFHDERLTTPCRPLYDCKQKNVLANPMTNQVASVVIQSLTFRLSLCAK